MAFNLPPPPVGNDVSGPAFRDWFYKLTNYLTNGLTVAWSNVTGTPTTVAGYGITDAGPTRNVLEDNVTVEEDTSYIVMGYLDTDGFTLTVNGNIGVL
jgi:hypothetical protein